jgi:hypothetical protein
MRTHVVRLVYSAVLVLGLGLPLQAQQPPTVRQPAAQPSGDMAAGCEAMMAGRQKMMADMKAADQRLNELVARMDQASGQAKVDAVAAVVQEMVTQRQAMRDRMMQMHQQGMRHMGEHMESGAKSMAMCPMMKMGGMQH